MEICPRRHRTRVKWTQVLSYRNRVRRTRFSFASRTDQRLRFLVLPFLFLLSPYQSSYRPTLHFQAPKTHEQNQIQTPKQILDRIRSSPLARSSLELQHVLLLHWNDSDITGAAVRNHTYIKSDPISLA